MEEKITLDLVQFGQILTVMCVCGEEKIPVSFMPGEQNFMCPKYKNKMNSVKMGMDGDGRGWLINREG